MHLLPQLTSNSFRYSYTSTSYTRQQQLVQAIIGGSFEYSSQRLWCAFASQNGLFQCGNKLQKVMPGHTCLGKQFLLLDNLPC